LECSACFLCALHDSVQIQSSNCHWQQTNRSQHRVTAAYIVRNDKGFITFCVCQTLECTACLVCGCKDAVFRAFLAVLVLNHFLENAERDSRFCGLTRLRNNVYREIAV